MDRGAWSFKSWTQLSEWTIKAHTYKHICCFSVTKSRPTLGPQGLQHARPPCPSLSPRVCPSSCPLNQWYYPTISSSAAPFSFCLQSFPEPGLFQWVGYLHQVAKVLEISASVLPMNTQWWFPLGLTFLISLQSKGLSRVFSSTTVQSINSSALIVTFIFKLRKHIHDFTLKLENIIFASKSRFSVFNAYYFHVIAVIFKGQLSFSDHVLHWKEFSSLTSLYLKSGSVIPASG